MSHSGGGGGTVGGGADAAILALWPADLLSMGMQKLRQCADFLGGKFCNSFARANFPVQKFNILSRGVEKILTNY